MVSATPTVGDAALAHDLRTAVLRLARRIRAARVDTSLSLSQLSALGVLDAYGPMSAGDLAGLESVQPPTMTKVVAALTERGFVSREPDPLDKRAVRLAVTEAGHAVIDAERRARDAWLRERLDRLDPSAKDVLAAAVSVLNDVGGADPEPTS